MYETCSPIYHKGKFYVDILRCFFVFLFSFFFFLVRGATALFSLPKAAAGIPHRKPVVGKIVTHFVIWESANWSLDAHLGQIR
jgi:hypothetical protein